jgi:NAD(P) transhydrogenase subunit alpha
MVVGVPKETAPGERRVALVPEVVKRLQGKDIDVVVEAGAGERALIPDAVFEEAGASIGDPWGADVVAKVAPPTSEEIGRLRSGGVLVGFLAPLSAPDTTRALAQAGVTAFAMEAIPRISRAEVLVLGAGVAGLQALATAKRLGARTTGYDVRPEVAEQVQSLGAQWLDLEIEAAGEGGYARELTEEEREQQQQQLTEAIKRFDVVITTALVPGRPAPKLVTAEAVEGMKPGSVIVDLAGETGGNCELTEPGETVVKHDVTIVSPLNLPATMPEHASQLYARNIQSLLELMLGEEGELELNFDDEVIAGACVVRDGDIVHEGAKKTVEAAA